MIISTDIVDIHDSRLVDMNMLEPVQNKKWLLPSRHLCSTTSRLITFYHHQKIATSAIRKKKKKGIKVLTMSAMPGPSRSHWFSRFSMRPSINEVLLFASAWASVRNLTQSSHTALLSSWRKSRDQMKTTINNNNTTGGEHIALHVGGDGI